MKNEQKVYFKNLNGLRFIAAFLVVVHHIEQIKSFYGLSNLWANPGVRAIGKLGVVLFFVLSGFLITYLLLVEKEITKTVNIKHFYIRRMLRIWPLYFLLVLLGLYILPLITFMNIPGYSEQGYEQLGLKTAFYLFFLPNIALPFFQYVPHISQTWSIGLEEQFYLIWPVIFKKIKSNQYTVLISVICLYLTINVMLHFLPEFTYKGFFIQFWQNNFNIDCMAIGGLFALLYYDKKDKILKFIYNKYLQTFTYILTILLALYGFKFPYLNYEIYAIFFGIIILNLATNPKRSFNIENGIINFLGKISYGIYMFHPIAIVFTIKLLLLQNNNSNSGIYLMSIALTVLLSFLSYHFFERKLIKLKLNYSKVISGDNAIDLEQNKSDKEEIIFFEPKPQQTKERA